MDHAVKRLEPSDIKDFKALLSVFSDAFGDPPASANGPVAEAYLAELLQNPVFYAFAAYSGKTVIGGLTGYELALTNQKKEIYIYDLAVAEKHRKRGVATALLEGLKASAKENGVSTLFVEAQSQDTDAVAFYRSLGAEQIGVEHFNIDIRY